jgi:hypothetical protein
VQFLNVLDLSKLLTFHEKKLLSKGLGFVPRKTQNSKPQLFFAQCAERIRKKLEPPKPIDMKNRDQKLIKLKMPPKEINGFPKFKPTDQRLSQFLVELDTKVREKMTGSLSRVLKPNVSFGEKRALESLRNRFEIVIKPSDKGSKVVVQKREYYLQEGRRYFVSTGAYQEIPCSLMAKNFEALRIIITRMVGRGFLSVNEAIILADQTKAAPRHMYFLPKVQKPKESWVDGIPPGRPIVANVGTEFAESSKMLTSVLENCLEGAKYLLKNSQDFLAQLKHAIIGMSPEERKSLLIVTADIDSCYTNIPQQAALTEVERALIAKKPKCQGFTTLFISDVMELLSLQMKNNDIYFNGKYYLQTRGISMGQSWGPTVCNIFFAKMDEHIVEEYHPSFYGRYIDDTFFLWQHGEARLNQMIADLNSRWAGVKLNFQTSAEKLPFLDLEIFLDRDDPEILLYRPYFKPDDTHELLHKSSNHPKHVFGGILKSAVLRLKRNSARETDLLAAVDKIRKALLPRGYSESFLARYLNPGVETNPKRSEEDTLPLVVDFDPRIAGDLSWVKKEWDKFRAENPDYGTRLPTITLAWRCTKSLRDMLQNKNSENVAIDH